MDHRLLGWARAVKSRGRWDRDGIPPLWLFTAPDRGADVLAVVAGLPKGLCGVVFRHDGVGGRGLLARRVWRICRNRRLAMVVAGAPAGVAGAGVHLRGGRGDLRRGAGVMTSSAHGVADLIRAWRAGAAPAFLSPAFPTATHPGRAALGPHRWAAMARRGKGRVLALGGIDGATVRRLPSWVRGVGAIGALLP